MTIGALGTAPRTPSALAAVTDVPVDPDRDTARRWLLEELSRPEYGTEDTLMTRLLDWLAGLFEGLGSLAAAPPVHLVVIVLVVLAVVVALAWWIAGPARLRRGTRRRSVVVHDDDARTAAQMRADADVAAQRGDWPTAVLERFRAVVRALEERAVLDERPGRTAREAARAGAARLPAVADDLHRAATLFDDVCYGHLPAGPDDDDTLRRLDAQTAAARPEAATTSPDLVEAP